MQDHLLKVCKFFRKLVEPKHKDLLNAHQFVLDDLIPEEWGETRDAVDTYKWYLKHGEITPEATENHLEAILDGYQDVVYLCDQMSIVLLLGLGFSDEEACKRVAEAKSRIADANLAKLHLDGEPRYNESGKVIKPEGWRAPCLKNLFRR